MHISVDPFSPVDLAIAGSRHLLDPLLDDLVAHRKEARLLIPEVFVERLARGHCLRDHVRHDGRRITLLAYACEHRLEHPCARVGRSPRTLTSLAGPCLAWLGR